MAQEVDEYGIGRDAAADLLWKYLKFTLGEKKALLLDLHLESGRWQARVEGSKRGVATVFLHQHGGKIVGGHTSAPGFAQPTPANQGEAAFRHQHLAEHDQDETLATQGVPTTVAAERRAEEREGSVHFQTLKWHEPTRHRAAPKPKDF